ncbi:hypothetical protein Ddye_020993 [Dipteronia dyeriana]|uniref:Reverse transcriptase n=1 Tax=Dipteronia dyeriana TaxID=168575 RepID=A0AAD9WX36_9ROSI|nr:hypothetical protein Ddye_020993 [Dipteronia dyeriana]
MHGWTLLQCLASMASYSWLVGGGFNEILYLSEKTGGSARQERLIENFRWWEQHEQVGESVIGLWRVEKELEGLLKEDEVFWKQRSRVSWLKQGDRYTKYFHAKATARWKRNLLLGLVNDNKECKEKEEDMELEEVFSSVEARLPIHMRDWLNCPFSKEDVRIALFQMDSFKAPGIDGFPTEFYQRFWDVVEEDVLKLCLECLNEGESQSAFIPKRIITNNAMVGFVCMHVIRRKVNGKRKGFMSLKLDMSKAYDRISSSFRKVLVEALSMNNVDHHDRYLGMPCMTGRSKRVLFEGIKERVWRKLQSLNTIFFSNGGCEILFKAVIQSIPVYSMNLFKLPISLISDLHRISARFWWGGGVSKRRLHWCSWDKLCKAKEEKGVLVLETLERLIKRCLRSNIGGLLVSQICWLREFSRVVISLDHRCLM